MSERLMTLSRPGRPARSASDHAVPMATPRRRATRLSGRQACPLPPGCGRGVVGDSGRPVPACERVLTMAWIERRELEQPAGGGPHVRYQVRYRDHAGKVIRETQRRLVDAERRKAEIELELGQRYVARPPSRRGPVSRVGGRVGRDSARPAGHDLGAASDDAGAAGPAAVRDHAAGQDHAMRRYGLGWPRCWMLACPPRLRGRRCSRCGGASPLRWPTGEFC